jgi:hypothetical protein
MGSIDGTWTHDLHDSTLARPSAKPGRPSGAGASSLASRITVPGAIAPSKRAQRRAAQVAQALIKTELAPGQTPRQTNALSANLNAASGGGRGISIKGLAGPYAVMAQNFAPGTTAADIESAVTPVGGLVTSCRLLKTSPIVIAEIVFESREGADAVIATFNNQFADGRMLHVYPKIGGAVPTVAQPQPAVVDGTHGFDEPMEVDGGVASGGGGKLYSDTMVANKNNADGTGRGNANGGRRGRPRR